MVRIVKKPNKDIWRCEVEILVREGSSADWFLDSKAQGNGHESQQHDREGYEADGVSKDVSGVLRGILKKLTSKAITRLHPEAINFDLSDSSAETGSSVTAIAYHITLPLTKGEMDRLTQLVPNVLFDDETPSDAARPEVFGVTVHRFMQMKQ